MVRANLTLQLDAEVIKRARIVAAKRGTSVSALAAAQLTDLVNDEERFEQARQRAVEILGNAGARGGRNWKRDDLHDRPRVRGE